MYVQKKRILKGLRRSLLFVAIYIVVGLLLAKWGRNNLVYNYSPSAPMGLYLRKSDEIKEGDWVILENPRKDLVDDEILLKQVEKIKDGKAWLSGRDESYYEEHFNIKAYSFDSDYFGWVDLDKLTKCVLVYHMNEEKAVKVKNESN